VLMAQASDGGVTMTTRRLWIPVLVSLLVAVLIGPAGGAVTAIEPRLITANIMVPAGAFIPVRTTDGYQNAGTLLWTDAGGEFLAPITFPVPIVNVRRITLYSLDTGSAGEVCVSLYRTRPTEGSEDTAAFGLCSTDDPTDPGVVSTTAIDPRRVNTTTQSAILSVFMSGEVGLRGVKVTYTYEP
jgi:hypothetical protein